MTASQQLTMIANLKPYDHYENLDRSCLGKAPSHWEPMRLKRLLRPVDRRSSTGSETLLSLRRDHGVVVYADHFSRPPQGSTLVGFKLVQAGQLVVNRMQANNGLLFHSRLEGLVSPDYSVFEAKTPVLMDYLSDLVRSPSYRTHFRRESTGLGTGSAGFLRLYDDRFLNTVVAIPPVDEQQAIVRFLRWLAGRFGQVIRAKRKVIALLSEQKQAIIHRAVTRGLDPSVPFKPSRIPWLGDIPKHWEMRRTKTLSHIKTGGRDTIDRIDGAPYPFFVRSQTVERIDTYSFDGEAVLTAGDGAGVAKVFHYVDGKFDYHQRVYKFSNFKRVSGKFFFYYLRSTLRYEALDASAKSTVDSLRLPLLQNFPTVVPPGEEQKAIVRAIEMETGEIDTAISRLEREIALLHEYRTRLVADVVTGKLDVREAALHLPDEPGDGDSDERDVLGEAEDVAADDLDAVSEEAEE